MAQLHGRLSDDTRVCIGVLCLQGSFSEHVGMLKRIPGVQTSEVRLPSDLEGLDGLIFPGGESTSMAIVGESTGIFPALKEWTARGKPVWGTCAGMILLSNSAVPQKTGGQALVGGLDIEVCRNFFGSQVQSCEMNIDLKVLEVLGTKTVASRETSRAVFIRAPAVLKTGPSVTVLARVQARPSAAAVHSLKGNTDFPRPQTCDLNAETHQLSEKSKSSSEELMPVVAAEGKEPWDVAVAVRQGSLLATAFHPEFTPEDTRWHQYFVSIVREARASWLGKKESSVSS